MTKNRLSTNAATHPERAHAPDATPVVFKICDRNAWEKACETGRFHGSSDDARDGFIHFSAPHQLAATAAKHFRNAPDLLLVAIAVDRLPLPLRWEASRGGELFPHLYAPLPTTAALWITPLPLGPDGVPVLPTRAGAAP